MHAWVECSTCAGQLTLLHHKHGMRTLCPCASHPCAPCMQTAPMQDFYEDVFEELNKFGELENLNVCDNLADHLVGNVYVKYRDEEDAARALAALQVCWGSPGRQSTGHGVCVCVQRGGARVGWGGSAALLLRVCRVKGQGGRGACAGGAACGSGHSGDAVCWGVQRGSRCAGVC